MRWLTVAPLLVGLAGCATSGAAGGKTQAKTAKDATQSAVPSAKPLPESALQPIAPKAGEGRLQVQCTPATATVVLDGVEQGHASDYAKPPFLAVSPGAHHIKIEMAGYTTYHTEVWVSGSVIETISAHLIRLPAAAPTAKEKSK